MASFTTRPTANYVKFVRGQKSYYNNIVKNSDTLYFIYENSESTTGELYLGDKKIGTDSIVNLSSLISSVVNDGDLLIYDSTQEDWIPTSLDEAIRIMTGATANTGGQSGLVPAPSAGDQDKFLRGNGTWASVNPGTLSVDDTTIELNSIEKITIKGFDSAPTGSTPQKTNNGLEWVSSPGGVKYKKVTSLSDVTETSTIYLIPNNSGTSNAFDEYMLIDNQPELIGNTATVNLENYLTKTAFQSTVANLQDSLNSKVNTSTFNTLSNKVDEIDSKLTWQEIVEN